VSFHEIISPGEEARFEGYAAELRAMQKGPRRALHAKQHLGAEGRLEVAALPAQLRVAVFAEPKTWPVYLRFSNGSGRMQHDGIPDVRGIAVKLRGVPGRKIIKGLVDKKTQDFLFIHTPATPFRTPDEFVALVRIAAKGKALLVPRIFAALGPRRALQVLRELVKLPKVTSMATIPFYTATPIRFGQTAAKLAIFPDAPAGKPALSLRDDLVDRLGNGPLSWTLRAQLFADDASTPIEDASVEWKTPFVDLARLILPQQKISPAIEDLVEKLSFDPWHALEELRPLGAMMRARAPAYRESVIARGAAPEPEA
jgi:hypothetical protein